MALDAQKTKAICEFLKACMSAAGARKGSRQQKAAAACAQSAHEVMLKLGVTKEDRAEFRQRR